MLDWVLALEGILLLELAWALSSPKMFQVPGLSVPRGSTDASGFRSWRLVPAKLASFLRLVEVAAPEYSASMSSGLAQYLVSIAMSPTCKTCTRPLSVSF